MSKYRLGAKLRKEGIWPKLEPVLIENGITEYRTLYSGKHPFVEFVCNAQTSRFYFSLTPSDRRNCLNTVAQLRRRIREMKNA